MLAELQQFIPTPQTAFPEEEGSHASDEVRFFFPALY